MTSTDTHLLLAVRNGVAELAAPAFLGWHDAQNKWALLDAERRAAGTPVGELHYAVRSADDPKYAHLLPKLYKDYVAAAQALARKLHPTGAGYYPRAYLASQLGWVNPWARGWHSVAKTALAHGYLGKLADGRCYLTPLASTLPVFSGSYSAPEGSRA